MIQTSSSVDETGVKNAHARCVREYACVANPNYMFRPYMEDRKVVFTLGFQCIDQYGGFAKQGYFAVFDGHGGKEIADFCSKRLHEIFLKSIKDGALSSPEKLLKESFVKVRPS
eukprot:TRINITY_DN2361_c0_g2_i1.p3 TRINITY_DN2361_c0_g2~~TRINITY_DN2361_c0_g2_i1.p3  ORF type:complete len:114 (-),score=25.73 TRINITY_DN2361_c0_g2_i1:662-1003(-)